MRKKSNQNGKRAILRKRRHAIITAVSMMLLKKVNVQEHIEILGPPGKKEIANLP